MFNNNKILVDNYIPYYPTHKSCLHDTLLIEKYKRICQDLKDYFVNVELINFDIIHHQCRGDALKHDVKYYQEICHRDFENIPKQDEYNFISSAIKSRRKDIYIQKDVMKNHFVNEEVKEKLKSNIFLSSMQKKTHKNKIEKMYSDGW